jgi:hypothetical protein
VRGVLRSLGRRVWSKHSTTFVSFHVDLGAGLASFVYALVHQESHFGFFEQHLA